MRKLLALILIVLAAAILYTQLTLFVVQPIGALPEGRTLLILRLNHGLFIDSADAMCKRIQDSVNLLCRAMVLGAVAKNSSVLARLPYSQTLYEISTGGVTYTSPDPNGGVKSR